VGERKSFGGGLFRDGRLASFRLASAMRRNPKEPPRQHRQTSPQNVIPSRSTGRSQPGEKSLCWRASPRLAMARYFYHLVSAASQTSFDGEALRVALCLFSPGLRDQAASRNSFGGGIFRVLASFLLASATSDEEKHRRKKREEEGRRIAQNRGRREEEKPSGPAATVLG
jgi:hypothetical protein